ncbi:hypothetical protein [Kribbella ginsengisoli]|uniref:Uncharacterized protein n=1 Tax=Kribbella ginsengisoli TaxID=363865 RepID=A0ABP6Y0A9_9ACTN
MSSATGVTDPILALEIGEWRTAQRLLRADRRYDAMLGAELRTIARAMAYRAAGEHGAAWSTLVVTAANLRRRFPKLPVLRPNGIDAIQLALPPEPEPGSAGRPLYETIRLICREQGELRLLRRQAGESGGGLTEDRRILVLAFIEAVCWVELDLDTWAPKNPPDDEIVVQETRIAELADRRRDAFLRSASNLRRLARPTAGDMTKSVWDRADQYCGLRYLALSELAGRPQPPWSEPALLGRLPVRTWAQNAWQMARRPQFDGLYGTTG